MNELIRKRDVIKEICEDIEWLESQGCTEIPLAERKERDVDIIKNLPPVQPKRGKWIERESDTEDKEYGFETVIVCSRCGYPATTFYSEDCESRTQIRTAFCPTCGADMREVRKDGTD